MFQESTRKKSPITSSKTEFVEKKKFTTNKSPGPEGFTGEF